MSAEAAVAYLSRTDSVAMAACELAVALSTAAFVEPALLRAVRLDALPELGVEAEADLWFSPLVHDRMPDGMSFEPSIVPRLQQRLVDWLAMGGRLRERAQHAAAVILERDAPELRRIGERVTWWSLSEGEVAQNRIAAALAPVVEALRENRPGYARWARRTLPRLPLPARSSPLVWEAAARASSIEHTVVDVGTPKAELFEAMTLDLPRVTLPVRRRAGILDVGAFQAHRAWGIEVPDTRPLYLAVTAGGETQIVALLLSESRSLEVGRGIVMLRTLNGDIYRLDAARSASIDRDPRAPIATLTFKRRSPREFTLHGEFLSGDVVVTTIAESTIRQACREAGRDLARFAGEVARVRRDDPQRLQLVFTNLNRIGGYYALGLAGRSSEGLRRLQQAFRDSWPTWQRPTREAIPRVDVIADEPAAAFPLELLPIFDSGEIPPLENASVIETVASRFLGFTAVVSRNSPNKDREVRVLNNDPLRVQYIRYVGSGEQRAGSAIREEEFLASLQNRGLVALDRSPLHHQGPHEAIYLLLDALRDGPAQLLHFASQLGIERNGVDQEEHLTVDGRVSVRSGEIQPRLLDELLEPSVLGGQTPGVHGRVVFFASCDPGPIGLEFLPDLQGVLSPGALVGPNAAIDDADAADYYERLYRFLLGGHSLGEAVVLARRQLLADTSSPVGLLYVLHGNEFRVEKPHPEELPQFLHELNERPGARKPDPTIGERVRGDLTHDLRRWGAT